MGPSVMLLLWYAWAVDIPLVDRLEARVWRAFYGCDRVHV
jgi:hypothetical protein